MLLAIATDCGYEAVGDTIVGAAHHEFVTLDFREICHCRLIKYFACLKNLLN